MPNVRGSTGYGRADTASDDGALRLDSVRDLAAAHGWLVARPGLDPTTHRHHGTILRRLHGAGRHHRISGTLEGGGGLLRDRRFRHAAGGDRPWRRAHRSREYGDPVHDAALFERISPIRHAGRITAPLLVLHGTRDPRVPFGESEQIVAALHGRGHPVTFERFDYAGHGFIRPADRSRAYAAVARFFREKL